MHKNMHVRNCGSREGAIPHGHPARATPCVCDAQYRKALKRRNRQSIPNVPFIKLRDDGDSRTSETRPVKEVTEIHRQ